MCDRSPHSTDNIVEETGMIRDLAPVSMRVIGPGHRPAAAGRLVLREELPSSDDLDGLNAINELRD